MISATENIPDTPEGIILESLLEGMAEYYSAELSQKVKRGIAESRKKGQMTGGRTPLGYSVSNKKYVINEEEAEIVKIIFTEYVKGTSAKEILHRLKAEGRTLGSGKSVSIHTIYNVAHKPIYAGDEIHPAIISKELWQRAKTVHEAQKNARVRVKTSRRYPLSGKVFCGSCGSKYTASEGNGKGGNYLYYKCSDKMRKRVECSSKAIRKELLEDIVFEACCEVLEGDFIKTVVDRAISISERKDKTDATNRLKDALREKERGIENILTAIEQGIITPTTKERLEALENEAQAIREQLRTEQNKKSASKSELTKFLSGLVSDKSDSEEFRETVFQLLVRSVIVFPDFIRITFHYSPTDGKDIPIDEIKEAIREFDIIDESTTKQREVHYVRPSLFF